MQSTKIYSVFVDGEEINNSNSLLNYMEALELANKYDMNNQDVRIIKIDNDFNEESFIRNLLGNSVETAREYLSEIGLVYYSGDDTQDDIFWKYIVFCQQSAYEVTFFYDNETRAVTDIVVEDYKN